MSSTIIVPGGTGGSSGSTLLSLSKDIAAWLNRTDLNERIPNFIQLAEAEFSREPRLRSTFQVMQVESQVPAGEIQLPGDLLELQELVFNDQVVKELPYDDWRCKNDPRYFARVGEVIHLTGKPAGSYRLRYLQRLPGLKFDADSNWLLSDGPDVYLWKCCELGSVWLRDPEAAVGYRGMYATAVDQMLTAINLHKWGGASIAVQSPGVV